ncbi:Sterol desaturase/sphingolipid hydroxylase, fatty acid hydroxylase superfamily [Polaromonas sp. OV174]|uniref:sterol desaturase family protein n=1 Tax=Polaromonas sp. OV174 TaxID=1855300 RepID=UPI0008F1672C|nr:sterol desaturase family protein [Polaromonas sp. OV174]SFB74890.1 Sterol desaturase/sphingolipid hydroxylase, fatty acid hydroxylase superfamily [Polaromonas sp. OV174]
MDGFTSLFSTLQGWLFETLVQPAMFALGLGNLLEDGYEATAWFMVGVIQIIVLLAVIGPLQRWRPVEPVTDRAGIRTDILYTLIHRLGLFRIALFFTLDPWFDEAFGALRTAGYGTFHLDQLWPGVTDNAIVSLLIYLVVFDFVAYWTHRGQHQLGWWWRLHSLHHSQRQMTMWSDNRNHLLDDILVDTIVVLVAQLIGVAPGQFVAIVAFTQLSESFQHANVRLWFGRIGERLWVSPRFHRLHHSIGIGHESPIKPKQLSAGRSQGQLVPAGGSDAHEVASVGVKLGGHNFGVLLPWWDMLFGTANFERRYDPTGIRDQVEKNRDYGRGFWSQQWIGLKRLVGRA